MTQNDSANFVKLVEISRLKEPQSFALDAPQSALAKVAARLGVPGAGAVSGTISVAPTAEGAQVDGRVSARLTRHCVVTLEPMDEHIDEAFSIRFAREARIEGEIELDLDDEWTEPMTGDTLDLADILVQQIALAMDPYPRKEGAAAPAALAPNPEDVSPFAALKALKPGPGRKH